MRALIYVLSEPDDWRDSFQRGVVVREFVIGEVEKFASMHARFDIKNVSSRAYYYAAGERTADELYYVR